MGKVAARNCCHMSEYYNSIKKNSRSRENVEIKLLMSAFFTRKSDTPVKKRPAFLGTLERGWKSSNEKLLSYV